MRSSVPMVPPPVTIIIPAYNYASFLAEAVDSALAQDHPGEVEVLVVDDGSTDETSQVTDSYGERIRCHRKDNAGLSAARNTGMELAAHDLVVFLDADDVLETDAVRRLAAVWQARSPQPVVVGSRGRMMNAVGEWTSPPPERCDGGVEAFTAENFVLRNRFAPIVLADRRALLALGGFDPALAASEDRDMWLRAATYGEVVMLRSALHRKRDHGSNMSRHALRQTEAIIQVLEKARRNPAIRLPKQIWREARAICLFQSARMHLAAGERGRSIIQCLRSIAVAGWVSRAREAGLPAAFRMKFLLLRIVEALRGVGTRNQKLYLH